MIQMKKYFVLIILITFKATVSLSQITVSGKVIEPKDDNAIKKVSSYCKGTYIQGKVFSDNQFDIKFRNKDGFPVTIEIAPSAQFENYVVVNEFT